MGTPGDKFPISKVVHGLLDSHDVDTSELIEEPHLEQSGEMTILRDIPSLGIFLEHGLERPPADKDLLLDAGSSLNLHTLEDLEKQLLFDSAAKPPVTVPLIFEGDAKQKPFDIIQEKQSPFTGIQSDVKQNPYTVVHDRANENILQNRTIESNIKQNPFNVLHERAIETGTKKIPFNILQDCVIQGEIKQNPLNVLQDSFIETDVKQNPFTGMQELALECDIKQKPFSVMQELSLPGPSGLQTPKAVKPSAAVKVPKRNKKPPPSSQTPKKPHLCSICNKNFQSSTKLASHQLVHSGGTPFKCEHCKKSFSSKFKLVRHVLIHSDRKPFSCTVCERTFHRKDHLKNHIKVHSPSKKVYVCEKSTCRKEYTSVMSFRKHLALHSAEEGGLECKICFKTFETKPDILYHLKIHAGSRTVKNPNEKKFTCDYCDRKFFTRKDVRRHLVVHTGSRNFLCQFCPQRFGRKDHLVRHIKKSHSTNYSESESTDTTPMLDTSSQDEQNYSSKVKNDSKPIDSVDNILEYPPENKTELKLDIPSVENIMFSRRFTELSPMLCSEPEGLQYLPHASSEQDKLGLLPGSSLPSDTELLTELVVMKEELEQQLGHRETTADTLMDVPHDIEDLHNPQLLPSDMIDTDILRLISEGGSQLTEDENNLPLPGFSQAFQQPP